MGHRTIRLTDEQTKLRVSGPIFPISPIVRCIIKCNCFLCGCVVLVLMAKFLSDGIVD